jgi:hypothetical protein
MEAKGRSTINSLREEMSTPKQELNLGGQVTSKQPYQLS